MKVEEVEKKTFLINPNLLREIEKLYKKLKKKKAIAERIEIIKTLSKANLLVKNIDNLIKGDMQARNLFKTYLSTTNNEIDLSYLKDEQTEEKLEKKSTFCFELDNFNRLYLISAKYWSLKKERWEIARSNLTIILKSLQIIQNDLQFMAELYKNKKDVSYIDFPRHKYYSSEFDNIQNTLSKTLLITVPCSIFMNRVFSPELLYQISQITDINGNDLFVTTERRAGGFTFELFFATLVCKNEILILKGDFTTDDPGEFLFVVVPTVEGFSFAEIIEWNRTEIKIKLPPNSTKGCIFIYDYEAEWNYTNCVNNAAEGELPTTDLPLPWGAPTTPPKEFNSQFEPPECDNYPGQLPIIEYIKINGEEAIYSPSFVSAWGEIPEFWKPVELWGDEPMEITFNGKFVEDVFGGYYKGWRLKIFTNTGIVLRDRMLNASTTSYTFTPHLEQSTELTIELSATNRCLTRSKALSDLLGEFHQRVGLVQSSQDGRDGQGGTMYHDENIRAVVPMTTEAPLMMSVDRVIKISKMIVKKKPRLKIVGIEVTQGIQHFNIPISENAIINDNIILSNNSVDLIKRRNTVFRVYIDTGIEETIPGVNKLLVYGRMDYGGAYLLHSSLESGSKFDIDRNEFSHSLNFKLPGGLLDSYMKNFSFRVFHPEREGEAGFEDTFNMSLRFKSGNGIDVMMVLYDNAHEGHEQSINDDGRTDDDIREDARKLIREYFPVPDDGITVRTSNLYLERHGSTKRDLKKKHDNVGWSRLGGDLENLAEGYQDWRGLVWLGLVPVNSNYSKGGMGWDRTWVTPPHAVAQAKTTGTIPHEIGHTHEIHHADCGSPPNIDDHLDDKLPDGRTHHTGVKVYKMETMPANTGDLMSYCDKGDRWTSIVTWEYLFEKIKDGA